jgi:hypothetical protein
MGTSIGSDLIYYRVLRVIFISGFAVSIVLTFIPSIEVASAPPVFGFGNQFLKSELLSDKDIIGKLLQENAIVGLFFVFLFMAQVAILVLAIKYPKRWVFIAGVSLTCLTITLWLFSTTPQSTTTLVIPAVFSWLATFAKLTGFFIHPPVTNAETIKVEG